MWTYSTNWMGSVNSDFIKKNGGGWAVPDHKFESWRGEASERTTGEGNPSWSGFSDEDILDAAFAFFEGQDLYRYAKNKPSVTAFLKWSSGELGYPSSWSKVRFSEYEGSSRARFMQAYEKWRKLND